MTLYDLLVSSEDLRAVSLLWIKERYLRESVRLGGRSAELVYKGSVLDLSRSFVGPIDQAVEFSLYQNCWDGMHSVLTESGGVLSGFHRSALSRRDGPDDAADLRDFNPNALYIMELVRVISGGSVLWEDDIPREAERVRDPRKAEPPSAGAFAASP